MGLLTVALLTIVGLSACATTETTAAQPITQADGGADSIDAVDIDTSVNIDQASLNQTPAPISMSALSEVESEGILYMREEEKLARDVYLTLYKRWELPVFQNIANSEQTHMDAVLSLIERYGLDDPAAGNDVGAFTNPDLQALYDQLIDQSSASLADALRVGGAIEEIDILDLEERLGQTDKADIQLVYESLMKGSRNHLRAFVSTLEQQTGESYQPQYLSQDVYDAIINRAIERGGNGRGNGQGNGQGRRAGQ
ncbi:MAG: DUF2202 domain-containing protein [Gammaproteobacteria bacterium]|nr:MAG: DUF2202 domain-containing protein [Gammaproteobacteria bacterium]